MIRTARRPALPRLSLSLTDMAQIWAERRRLAHLDAAQRRDLGLSAAQIRAEARRLPWDAAAR